MSAVAGVEGSPMAMKNARQNLAAGCRHLPPQTLVRREQVRVMRSMTTCAAYLALAACAGNGEGLDENGRPTEGAEETLQPTLASIQSNVFTPICTTCHAGAAAPLGLQLTDGASYVMLVNVPSVEVQSILRVQPGNPDASYLIQKLEGTAGQGARMPLNAPALSPETIATIRQWIVNGAPSAQATSMSGVVTLQAIWPLQDAVLSEQPREILLSANGELDTTLLSAGVMSVRASGGDGDFTNGNERVAPAMIAVRSLDPTVLAVSLPAGAWTPDRYEVRASGGAPLALADRAAHPIDGDGNGTPGGDFVLRFQVERPR
jgi:hypothetical protein